MRHKHTKHTFKYIAMQNRTKQTMTKDAFIQRVFAIISESRVWSSTVFSFFSANKNAFSSLCCLTVIQASCWIGLFCGRVTHTNLQPFVIHSLLICNLKLKLLHLNYDVFVTATLHDFMANEQEWTFEETHTDEWNDGKKVARYPKRIKNGSEVWWRREQPFGWLTKMRELFDTFCCVSSFLLSTFHETYLFGIFFFFIGKVSLRPPTDSNKKTNTPLMFQRLKPAST